MNENNLAVEPFGNRIVAVEQEASSKTASGLYLPDSAKEKPAIANVIAVGPEIKEVKTGDKIIYKKYSVTEVKINKKEYLLINEEDILARITKQ